MIAARVSSAKPVAARTSRLRNPVAPACWASSRCHGRVRPHCQRRRDASRCCPRRPTPTSKVCLKDSAKNSNCLAWLGQTSSTDKLQAVMAGTWTVDMLSQGRTAERAVFQKGPRVAGF
uniref:Low-carbon dioxide inducible protein n=1 Tax=Chlamydomonas reinhardtii TaxID=3055 RepID=O22457_CHLRE|nr:low-carbon dioxide inducible protein [Chlamydomonas reinhardtii]